MSNEKHAKESLKNNTNTCMQVLANLAFAKN